MTDDEVIIELASLNVQMRRLQRREEDLRRQFVEVVQVTDNVTRRLHTLNRQLQSDRNKRALEQGLGELGTRGE